MSHEIFMLDEHTWRIQENVGDSGSVYMYLLEGTSEALLIDTGFGTVDLKLVTSQLTKKHVKVLNTHFHFDHVGGNGQFEECYMHKADIEFYKAQAEITPRCHGLTDGDVLDLGQRVLTVIHTPGHTLGSVCILDSGRRWLFTGDTCCKADVLLNLANCGTVEEYLKGLAHLKSYGSKFSVTWPAHHAVPVEPEIIDRFMAISEGICSGSVTGFECRHSFGDCLRAEDNEIAVLYLPNRIR